MTSKKRLWLAVAILVFASAGQTSAGPNANAVVSLDLIADGGAGSRTDDGITSGVVSGRGTTIAVEIFATGVGTSLLGMVIKFEFDASLLSFVKAENSAFYLTAPEGSIGIQFAARNPVSLASSGYLARAEFETVSDVTATEFSIGIGSVTLAESMTSSDELVTTTVIRFNASPSPDFDGDDFVGFSDLLIFARGFGSHQGDGGYNAVVDLNSDGEIGFIDLLLFAESFGAPPPSTGGGNGGGNGGSPDLAVQSPSVNDNTLTTGQLFTLRATVRNRGNASSAPTTLQYYRSTDGTISTSDTQVGTDAVSSLSAGGTSAESISLNAPSSAGTYYYGACVESVSGESNTGNNCSSGVNVTVSASGIPDLIVESPSVNDNTLTAGQSFTLRATVRNQGNASSASTTLRYYRSSDATVSASDTQVGTDGVSALSAGGTSAESISLNAPSSAGTYYYGACVESVSGESNTGNNCSSGMSITAVAVTPPGARGVNRMYWTEWDTESIRRSDLDGSGIENLVTSGLDAPGGIALDVAGGKMYWTDWDKDKIQRSNLDGSDVEDLITGLTSPYAIALDVAGGKMYWTDGIADKIQRSNLDGSGVEDLITGLDAPGGIALDVAGGKMYWSDGGDKDKIQRSNLDGSGVEDLVNSGLDEPEGIALDVAGGKMYWADAGFSGDRARGKIHRSNLDGSGVEDLVTTGFWEPKGIALDVAGGKMYWTHSRAKIQRSNLDGSDVEDLITGLGWPLGIALGSAHVEAEKGSVVPTSATITP